MPSRFFINSMSQQYHTIFIRSDNLRKEDTTVLADSIAAWCKWTSCNVTQFEDVIQLKNPTSYKQIQSSTSLIEWLDPQIFITHHNSLSVTHSQIELITPTGLLPFLPDNSSRGHSLQSNQEPLPKEAPWEWGTKGDSIILRRASHNHASIKTDTLAPVKRGETVKVRQEFAPKVCNPQWSSMYVYIIYMHISYCML